MVHWIYNTKHHSLALLIGNINKFKVVPSWFVKLGLSCEINKRTRWKYWKSILVGGDYRYWEID
jgi:hypothetical protein